MTELAKQLLLTPENRGSNPVIGDFLSEHLFTVSCTEKTKINKKEAGNGPLLKKWKVFSSEKSYKSGRVCKWEHVILLKVIAPSVKI